MMSRKCQENMKEYLIKEQYEDHKNDLEGQRYKIMEEIFMATVME